MGANTSIEMNVANRNFKPWLCKDGTRVVASQSMWKQPFIWDRDAADWPDACVSCGRRLNATIQRAADAGCFDCGGKDFAASRPRVFCASLEDVFEDWAGPVLDADGNRLFIWADGRWGAALVSRDPKPGDEYRWLTMGDVRARFFQVIAKTPNLDWLLLSKRPENILRMTYDSWCKKVPGHVSQNEGDGRHWDWPANVWLGTSCENQEQADKRIPVLLQVPAAVRFVSADPLLGPIDLSKWLTCPICKGDGVYVELHEGYAGETLGCQCQGEKPIRWVIVGGESGPGARPMHPNWAQSIRDQCQAANVPFFFKQWGEWLAHSQALQMDEFPVAKTDWAYNLGDDNDMAKVGKKKAGSMLDGREWREFPAVGTRTEAAL